MTASSQRHTVSSESTRSRKQREGHEADFPEPTRTGISNHALSHALHGGTPLDPRVRVEMEARFGEHLGDVRVHNDASAHRNAAELGAKAYTVGNDITFGMERYAPHLSEGKRLLAHELAHVIQQRRGGALPKLDARESHESSADQAADAAVSGSGPVSVAGATGVGVACDKDEDEEKEKRQSQANMIVVTQRPTPEPKLDLPVNVINDSRKGKGTLAESNVPFALYSGPDWNHLGGGEETKSSRTSLARETPWGMTAGLDFLVENRKTGRLVIGEQKAVDKGTFENATAITTNLEKNVAQAQAKLQQKIDNGEVHPEEVAHVQEVIAKLEATGKALKNRELLPEGVIFELTNLSGEGKNIGKGHLDLLTEKYGDKPGYAEHLLGRTFVRDPQLAKEKGRDTAGKHGTNSDPDVVPAKELLTPDAKDEIARREAGKSKKEWEQDKKGKKAADDKANREAREAEKKQNRNQRVADEKKAKATASQEGERVRKETLQKLKEERALKNEPEPTTKRKRQQADNKLESEAKKAGREAKKKSFDDFKEQRKQDDASEKAKRQADESARKQQRDAEKQANAQREAQKDQAAREKKEAIKNAKEAGGPKNPEQLKEMNNEARRQYESERRNAKISKAAHYTNQAAAGLRAYDSYEEERKQGKGWFESGVSAGKTYLGNTNPVLGAYEMAQQRQKKDETGEQYYGNDAIDAWLGTIGETGAGYIVPGKAWDQIINAGVNLADAADDHMNRDRDPNDQAAKKASLRTGADLLGELTPSRMFSTVAGGGLRAWYDLDRASKGDFKAVDKFGEDAVRGKLGSIIQPWAMAGDFVGNLGSDDVGTALEKTVKKTEGTTLKKIGDASGDAMYELGQSKEAKSGKYGTPVQGISMMLGMTSDMIAGKSFEKALNDAADAGKGSIADTVGSALGDAAFVTVEKSKELITEEIPAAKKKVSEAIDEGRDRLSKWWNSI